MKTNVVRLSIMGYSTEFVGKQALLIKGFVLLVVAYACYKLFVQKTITITVA